MALTNSTKNRAQCSNWKGVLAEINAKATTAAVTAGLATKADAADLATKADTAALATLQPKTGNLFTAATLPPAAENTGRVVFCSDGNQGATCAAISNGVAWQVIALGNAVSIE